MNEDSSKIDWRLIYETTNKFTALKYFSSQLKAVFDTYTPFTEKRVKGKKSPWLSCEIKNSMNNRDKLLRKARKSKSVDDSAGYKRLRNYCTNLVKRAKVSFHRNLLNENTGCPRKFWSTIKTIFPLKSLKAQNQAQNHAHRQERVNNFSDYFKNAIVSLKLLKMSLQNFTWRYTKTPTNRTNKKFTISYISKVFIEKELRSLKRNKATGLDEPPTGLLKVCAMFISQPLCHIMNMSINTSTVPSIWKTAKVTPIFKSGNHELPANYRPIYVLSVI